MLNEGGEQAGDEEGVDGVDAFPEPIGDLIRPGRRLVPRLTEGA